MSNTSNLRMKNIEAARCFSMMLIIALHYIGKGGFIQNSCWPLGGTRVIAEICEALAIVAVNIYMLITGYFLPQSSFKPIKYVSLWFRVAFYSVCMSLIFILAGQYPTEALYASNGALNTYGKLAMLFPVSMKYYWFISAYMFFYLFSPLIKRGILAIDQKQFKTILIFLLIVFSGIKTILPVSLELDSKGYDVVWYIIVALTGAYISQYGCSFFKNKRSSIAAYFAFTALILLERIAVSFAYTSFGVFEYILSVMYNYNHFFVFASSVALFTFFTKCEFKKSGAIFAAISPYALGVYLLHENICIRYSWQNLFGASNITGPLVFIASLIAAIIVVFAVGIAVDFVRALAFTLIDKGLSKISIYKKIKEKLTSIEIS